MRHVIDTESISANVLKSATQKNASRLPCSSRNEGSGYIAVLLCSRAVTESETADMISYYLQVEGSGLIAIHENAQTLGSLLSFEPVDILVPQYMVYCNTKTQYIVPAFYAGNKIGHSCRVQNAQQIPSKKSRLPKRASGIRFVGIYCTKHSNVTVPVQSPGARTALTE